MRSPAAFGGAELTALIATRCERLEDEAASLACASSPLLATLTLSMCVLLQLPRLAAPRLVEANLHGCTGLMDHALDQLCEGSPRLARLGASLCAALEAPVLVGASLRQLNLSHCQRLRAPRVAGPLLSVLKVAARAMNDARRARPPHELPAALSWQVAGCPLLADEPLEEACRRCPRLTRLNIADCTGLRAPHLRSGALQVLSCQGLEPGVVAALEAVSRSSCPALIKLKSERSS